MDACMDVCGCVDVWMCGVYAFVIPGIVCVVIFFVFENVFLTIL